jgi:[ribosomal protein S5]-alanine N-acetyltransferase
MNIKELVVKEPELTGENIILKGLSKKFVSEKYAQWLNDKKVCVENRHGSVKNTIYMTEKYVESVDRSDTAAAFAIITKAGDLHIGNVCLENISWENRSGEIAILIGEKDFWGKGIATEAYKLIIDYGFNMLDLHRLYSGMTIRNKAMIKVAERSGMTEEGILKESLFKDGIYVDIVRYAIINPKHKKRAGK